MGLKVLDAYEDYCLYGSSLSRIGEKLGITRQGARQKILNYSQRLSPLKIFRYFEPQPSPVVCMDITIETLCGEEIYKWFGKCPYTKIASGWLLSEDRGADNAEELERMIIDNINFQPKIWVSDGEYSFHTALLRIYSPFTVRTIYLGRAPKENDLKDHHARNTYMINKKGDQLLVEKNIISPFTHEITSDENGYEKITRMTLDLFNEERAHAVCLMSPYKFIPFKNFCKRFLYETRNDNNIYHFIGTGSWGNPWAESLAKLIKKRYKWLDRPRRINSGRALFNVQMVLYNLFHCMDELGGKTPFEYSGGQVIDEKQRWDILYNMTC